MSFSIEKRMVAAKQQKYFSAIEDNHRLEKDNSTITKGVVYELPVDFAEIAPYLKDKERL